MFPKSSTCFALVGAATAENISPDVLFLLPPATTMSLMFLAGSATSGGDVSYPGGMLEVNRQLLRYSHFSSTRIFD